MLENAADEENQRRDPDLARETLFHHPSRYNLNFHFDHFEFQLHSRPFHKGKMNFENSISLLNALNLYKLKLQNAYFLTFDHISLPHTYTKNLYRAKFQK